VYVCIKASSLLISTERLMGGKFKSSGNKILSELRLPLISSVGKSESLSAALRRILLIKPSDE
jgi:hypothetical protein